MKHYKPEDFLSNFRISVPLHKRSLQIEDRLVMVLLVTNEGKE